MAGHLKISKVFTFLLFLLVVCDRERSYLNGINLSQQWNGAAVIHVGGELSKVDICYSSSRRQRYQASRLLPLSLKWLRVVNLTQKVILVNVLLLCNDISLNPGPPRLSCPKCVQTIKKNQARTQCTSCHLDFHLKCLDSHFETTRSCSLCSVPSVPVNREDGSDDINSFLPKILNDMTKARGMKFIHQNVRSLLGKIDELRLIISELNSEIHLLTLSETWLHKDITDAELQIAGYQLFRRDRGAKGGGLAVYVRNDVSVVRRTDLENVSVEGLWLEVLIPKSRSLLVGTFYRPPNSSSYHDKDFMSKFEGIMDLCTALGNEIIIMGDLNCDFLAKRAIPTECKQLKVIFKTLNFTQRILQATRITQVSKTLLDVFATNCPQNISLSGVASTSLSDHSMIFGVRKLNHRKAPAQTKLLRNYANYDPNLFCQDLNKVDWDIPEISLGNTVQRSFCLNDLWSNFRSAFVRVADHHAPLIQKRVRGINNCPWMTSDIKKDIRQRDYYLKKARKNNKDEDWLNYRSARNRVTNIIKKAKNMYNRKLVDDNSNDPKAFWKTIKNILPGEGKTKVSSIVIDGEHCTDSKKIANVFNNFFIGAVKRLMETIRSTGTFVTPVRSKLTNDRKTGTPPFKFEVVTQEFVKINLKKLKTKKSSGLDNISPRLLIDSAEIVAGPLTSIINASLTIGVIPDDWKCARVTPLFKKGKRNDMDNYRPISVLPVASKLLERAVHSQLYCFLSKHKLLSPHQCGFRKHHSTESAAISLTDSIRRGMDQGLLTGSVFIDLRKAFDTVDHETLVTKLETFGIADIELTWFREYLSNRKQVVAVENELSDLGCISTGVPQGSILGPLLFVLLMNDLPDRLNLCSTLMYADDTVLFYSSKDIQDIETVLTRELKVVSTWLTENNLYLHKDKTESVLFGTGARLSKVTNLDISVNGNLIKRKSQYTYLGIVLDETLSFNAHVKYVLSKAGKRLGMLGRIRDNLTMSTSNIIYKSFILPVLDYCDTVWNCCGKGNADLLERLQRRAARIIMKKSSSDEALKSLTYDILEVRRDKHVYNLVRKCIAGRSPQFFKNYFTYNKDIVKRSTRQSALLHLPRVRTECAKKSFYYYGCVVFNRFKAVNN